MTPVLVSTAKDLTAHEQAPPYGALALVAMGAAYNWPLAILNAQFFTLSRNLVILVEVGILFAAFCYALMNWQREMTRWISLICSVFVLFSFLTIGRGEFAPKDIRDLLIIAIFIMVGITLKREQLVPFFICLQCVVVFVAAWEVTLPDQYSQFTNAKSYYINTRGFEETNFSVLDSNFFNAFRGEDREILPILGWIRASSIFLEPVGLGNYCAVLTLFMLCAWPIITLREKCFFGLSWIFIIIACDGRFAIMTSMLLLLLSPLLRRTPSMVALFFVPGMVGFVGLLTTIFYFDRFKDTLSGRLARGAYELSKLKSQDYLGFKLATPALADSGIPYLIVSQSLLGACGLLVFLFFRTSKDMSASQKLIVSGTALLIALSLMVSNSILSIKTAAPLWLLFGMVLTQRNTLLHDKQTGQ
jgi:putative polymerase